MKLASVKRVRTRIDALQPRRCWRLLDRVELPLLKWVARVRLGGGAERATALITRAGEHGILWYAIAATGALVDAPRRARWREAGLTVATAYAAGSAIKLAARRARPPIASIDTETALSFPSQHAATSFAAARTLAYLLPSPLGAAAAYGGALAVTGSRLHFCVHYPSDLLAGAALGDAIGRATVRRWRRRDQATATATAPAPATQRRDANATAALTPEAPR